MGGTRGGGSALRDRVVAAILGGTSAGLARLPAPLVHALGDAVGAGLYLAQPARRGLVRANLERVCRYLDERGTGSSDARTAARDVRALDRLVRRAFGHYVRSYLEIALTPSTTPERVDRALTIEDRPALERTLSAIDDPASRGLLVIALHFGSVERAGMWINARAGIPMTVPMETIANKGVQRFLEERRGAAGLRIVPAEGSGRALQAALGRREGVAVVADRPIGGHGRPVLLFGAPAPLPAGPALLAVESGATVAVGAARRDGRSRYRGRLVPIDVPSGGSRRERVNSVLDAQARAFESLIGDAPEQWWTLFFPIWPDLAAPTGHVQGAR